MTKNLGPYLDHPVCKMLEDEPFRNWTFEKSFDEDILEVPIFHYVFPQHGLALRCDHNEKISAMFLYSDKFNGFDERLLDLPFSTNRQQVIERLGSPSKSGSKSSDPILGEYGPWDRFARGGHVIHVEYRADADRIKMIILMRDDVVP